MAITSLNNLEQKLVYGATTSTSTFSTDAAAPSTILVTCSTANGNTLSDNKFSVPDNNSMIAGDFYSIEGAGIGGTVPWPVAYNGKLSNSSTICACALPAVRAYVTGATAYKYERFETRYKATKVTLTDTTNGDVYVWDRTLLDDQAYKTSGGVTTKISNRALLVRTNCIAIHPNLLPASHNFTLTCSHEYYNAPAPLSFDVIVYGGSWPAVAAAIRAKQQGRSVALIMSRDVVGGITRSGLQFTDAYSSTRLRASIPESGLTNQLFAALAATYGLTQQAHYRDYSYASESKTTGVQIDAMLAAVGIVPYVNQELLSLTKGGIGGLEIVSANFSGIGTVLGKQWIEGSYTGELLTKSGADFYIGGEAVGTETAQQAGFVIAGGQGGAIDPYINPGVPGSGLIKYVQNLNAANIAVGSAVPDKVQFPGYRLSLTASASKKVVVTGNYPFPLPADAIPGDYANWPSKANYELHRRDALLNKTTATGLGNFLNLQTGFLAIPTKTASMVKRDGNNGSFASLDHPDVALNAEYFAATTTRARRLEIEDIVWQYTLGYLYFLANDPAIPSTARTEIATWGFVNDDYFATNGRPPLMYPREGPRAKGDTVLTASVATTLTAAVTDPCCLAYYAFDKHSRMFLISTVSGVDRVIQEGGTPNTVTAASVMARIPSTILNPKKTQCSNLQVVTTPNCTQMLFNSYRLEPIMATAAEYAGIRAALAVATSTPVQNVPHASVAAIHNLFGLDPAGGTCITTDGTRSQGALAYVGTWGSSATVAFGTSTIATVTQSTGTHSVTYTPLVPASGQYKVQVKYSDTSGVTRGAFSSVTTAGGTPQTAVTLNQNSNDAGVNTNGDWQTVYTGALVQGDSTTLTYTNTGNPSNIIGFRIVPA